ncbi:DUF3108 domain-containing protein [Ramlibacter sp.]|uniref:DUF3108 domain-containing protein n=1 Tax=Ramlibacter sp. TaxID=1917967 RepID=UPI003D0F41CB
MTPWKVIPPARLAAIAAAVATAHVALLAVEPASFKPPELKGTQAFVTRRIEPPAAPTVAAPAPAPAPRAAARRSSAPSAPSAPPAPPPPAEAAPSLAPSPSPEATQVEASEPAPRIAQSETDVGAALDSQAAATPPAPPPAPPPEPASPAPGPEAAPTRTIAIPAPAKIRYDVVLNTHGLSLQSQAELAWRHDGRRYEARLEVGGGIFPTRVQQSTGLITPDGLAPLRFSEKTRNETATHFDRDKGRLVFSNNRPESPLLAGMQDRLSVIVQLSALIGAAPQDYPVGTQIVLPTAGTRDADTWTFHVEREEESDLPGGKVPTLKLQRLPRKEFDVKVELWLAPGMDYAPVRLRLTNPNGDWVDQRWVATDRG